MNIIEQKINALKTGVKNLNSSDFFIVSYPKSGNTWLRFIIANLISDELITMKNLNDFVPGIHNFKDKINQMDSPRFIKSHFPFLKNYPKTIYIYRDYRDVLVSYYHFQKSQEHFEGNISEFIRQKKHNPFGQWKKHVETALVHKKKYPDKILILKYEDLLSNPEKEITRIISFCGLAQKKELNEVIELCSFNSLQKNESQYGKVFENKTLTFFRKGKSNQWKEEFSDDDIKYIMNENGALLSKLGYK